ncbi:peptide-methionine (S)-S-oxide reductase MsrA [bacterium]|nr:peptide-methionine (S)-S-oxide reductase MsrA [bacterium]MBU1071707.1 peptide-methionine (S)-S-oxide reductase MsrA [bacterium]MBU1676391.1 peptide-methionine (S)-S-oxide reductase MsrA [bacterium]
MRIIIMTLALSLAGAGGTMAATNDTQKATLAGGCYWCLEAVFEELEGVVKVDSGFAGGGKGNVTYEQVCAGGTGHAEVVQIAYDPARLSYEELLTVFFSVHDPTTLNRQGADAGEQYRSAIFFHDDAQRAAAARLIADLTAADVFDDPIVTQVTPFDAFIRADEGHQDYYRNNKNQPYCRVVISPKLDKFREKFRDRLKR